MDCLEKMFKKITILLKKDLDIEEKIIREIKSLSNGGEVRIIAFDDLDKKDLEGADLVVSLGGDGTFVRAANLVDDCLIMGINVEPHKSEGALTSLDLKNINRLKDIFSGNFDVIKRYRARVRLNGKILGEEALNEVYVGALSQFHSSRYVIKFKDKVEEHRSSGVIISTGTGSGAWFFSAGGKVFKPDEEKLGFIVREPYFGKRIFTPKLLEGFIEKGEKLIIESKRDFGGIVAINESVYGFNRGEIVEIELSDKPVRVISLRR